MTRTIETAIIPAQAAPTATYESDVVAWSREQARLLRVGEFARLDIEHIADEIEDVGKSEQRELANRMAVLLAHLLKWRFRKDRRSRSWIATIRVQRVAVERRLNRMPSLKASLRDPEWWANAWADAILQAANETGLDVTTFSDACPWEAADILSEDWLPE